MADFLSLAHISAANGGEYCDFLPFFVCEKSTLNKSHTLLIKTRRNLLSPNNFEIHFVCDVAASSGFQINLYNKTVPSTH